MEALLFLLGLVLLAFPFAAISALLMGLRTRDRLRAIEWRMSALERRLGDGIAVHPAHVPPAQETPQPVDPGPPQASEPEPAQEEIPERFRDTGAPPPEDAAPAAEPPLQAPAIGFEERFGTRWVVWVGGVALALGGIFLVRYSIEQGYLGPGVRIFLGALLALALIAAGEWARRAENLSGVAGLPSAHIPSILTAAGTTVAYATVYAAYALYGFLAPGAAFILLGIVALLTLAAALLHGPALAGLGLVGAYVTPMLVASAKPDYWSLYIYLAIVTAAAFALARARLWRWLAITAVVFGVLWILPGLGGARVEALGAHAFHALAGFALAAALIVSGFLYGPSADAGRIDGISSSALSAYLAAAALLVFASQHETPALATFVVLAAATVAVAWRTDAAAAAVPAAAVLAALVIAQWAVDINVGHLIAPGGPAGGAVPEPERFNYGTHLAVGAALAALFGGVGYMAQGRSQSALIALLWSASATFAPVAILVALYYRVAGLERSIPFAALALLLAALYALATETLLKRAPRPGIAASAALFATGTLAALALALTFALEKGWLTVALALMVPGIAWIARQRPLPFLRWLAAAFVVIVLLRIGWEPRIVGSEVGSTPIFNWLLYGYGVPAAAFWYAGSLLRARADDVPARIVDAGAILFTVLLAFLEIRHYVNAGDVYRAGPRLAEVALHVCVWLALAIGLERLRLRTGSIVHNVAAAALAALAFLGVFFGLFIEVNPLISGERIGGVFWNLILLGYGLPAILAAVLARIVRATRPKPYYVVAAVTAIALALAYLTLEVRTAFHGPLLTGPTSDAEDYTYSAAWLAFGVALLLVGIALQSQPARLASAAVVILTVAKVFIHDLAGVQGFYRALSFICLGIVLMGIGLLYQRLLFPRRATSSPGGTPPPG